MADARTPPQPDPTPPAAPRPRAIALMNQKGGVGKTTTTVNLAAALAEHGRPTLLVDLDPQAHATMHLGVDLDALEGSVYDLLAEPARGAESVLLMPRPNLGLLPSEVNLAGAETELAEVGDRQRRLADAISQLGDRFQFVLIDCPPSLGLLTINALAAADEVIVPMQAHFLALQGVGKLLETVRLVARNVNPSLRVAGVILCMHDEQPTHTREVVADLEDFFASARDSDSPWKNARVYRPAIRRNIKLAECPSFGQTILEYAPSAAGAQDYRNLAAAFIEESSPASDQTADEKTNEHDHDQSAIHRPQIVIRSTDASAKSTP